jgi:hypothetical protein
MVTNETLTEMLTSKRPGFLFVSGGRIQFWDSPQGTGPIVATTREAADACAANLRKITGKRISVSEVGTVQGERLAAQIAAAVIEHGATGVFITDDGETSSYFQAPPFMHE